MRVCSSCTHPEREAVDAALVAGTPNRRIAAQFGLSEAAVRRHGAEHLPAALAHAQEAQAVAQAGTLLDEVRTLRTRALGILDRAEQAGDLRTALLAIREARTTVELLLEVEGELDRRPTVNVLVLPEWALARSALMEALRPYPEARAAVAARLEALEGV